MLFFTIMKKVFDCWKLKSFLNCPISQTPVKKLFYAQQEQNQIQLQFGATKNKPNFDNEYTTATQVSEDCILALKCFLKG